MTFSLYRIRGGLALLLAGGVLAGTLLIGSTASAQTRVRASALSLKACSISRVWHKLGPTYVEELKVAGVSCATGESVIKAYNACRLKSGGAKGYCHAKVDGFSFREQRSTGADQFVAKVTATKSRAAIDFIYSEDFD